MDEAMEDRSIPKSTLLFIRCLEYKYAKAFKEKGSIMFSNPSKWEKPDNTSRGDKLEGVYASQRGRNNELDKILMTLRNNTYIINSSHFTYYKSKDVMKYRAHCLFGLNCDNMHLQTKRSQDHRFHRVGYVTAEYFHNLFPLVNKEQCDANNDDRPAVLIIRPDVFIERIRKKLKEIGIKDEEIFISPVCYQDYYRNPFIIYEKPVELFSKDLFYKSQNEIRIVIDTSRNEIRSLLDKTNGIIEIGPIDDSIATLSEFYFDDMVVEERDGKLLYSLARPEIYEIEVSSYLSIMLQTLSDELPTSPLSIIDIESELEKYFDYLKSADENAKYDKISQIVLFQGQQYLLAEKAIIRMLDHYNTYMIDKDYNGAKDTIDKIHHFFPNYDFEHYFQGYYDWAKGSCEKK